MYVNLQIMIDRNIYVNSFLYSFHWVIPEKIHTHTTEGMLANLTGGGVNGSGNPDAVKGASEPKNTSSGVTSGGNLLPHLF